MRVYCASSWRNERQPAIVEALRVAGHDVYDFRNPQPGNTGFGWRQCASDHDLKDPRAFTERVLQHPVARAAFQLDMTALRNAEATVLVLPCGRSAHLELGYATGARQHTIVLLDDPMSEPELMYLMNSAICCTVDEVIERLDAYGRPHRRASSYPDIELPFPLHKETCAANCDAWMAVGPNCTTHTTHACDCGVVSP